MAPRNALHRLAGRPAPEDWSPDELLTLAEAAALLFPRGPLTAAGLRRACVRSELGSTVVCGRRYTTIADVADMIRTTRPSAPPSLGGEMRREPGPETFADLFDKRIGRGKARR